MINGVSSSEQTQATSQMQANLIALRNEAQNQQQIAEVLAEQAQPAPTVSSNPQGVGENVDTYA